ncbi:hypothetical protein LJ739_12850 [Aestuariibacter halophilus]|uniref:Secreted protein n=1 Tax=Fluctibacter halophilus TaxID=226011 RepID=A0ABS8G9L0_9ALTE|nr:hypothetical protein [Aestuariibacter halophilus]MCC2617134.1 hypothetical protein [Aestuariibacter halophilus]
MIKQWLYGLCFVLAVASGVNASALSDRIDPVQGVDKLVAEPVVAPVTDALFTDILDDDNDDGLLLQPIDLSTGVNTQRTGLRIASVDLHVRPHNIRGPPSLR